MQKVQSAHKPVPPRVRAAGVLVENGSVLIECQRFDNEGHCNWSFPGGKLEAGETLSSCLVREFREETGVEIAVGDLLYVCDRFRSHGAQVVDMLFEVRRTSDAPLQVDPATGRMAEEPSLRENARKSDGIVDVRMARIEDLPSFGFSQRLVSLFEQGFPHRGSYQGDFHAFYG